MRSDDIILRQHILRALEGFTDIGESFWVDGENEEHDAFVALEDGVVAWDGDDGTRSVYAKRSRLHNPSVIKNSEGEWKYLDHDGTIFSIEEAKEIGMSMRALKNIGLIPSVPRSDVLNVLVSKGAFCAVTPEGYYDRKTMLIMGHKVMQLGCPQARTLLREAGIIDADGSFVAGSNIEKLSSNNDFNRTMNSVLDFLEV